jgi:purine-nucleoside phosphorylase
VNEFGAEAARAAARAIQQHAPGATPDVALILGSGLGAVTDAIANAHIIPYAQIDAYPQPAVAGHAGRLVVGDIDATPVVAFDGRAHQYEGHSAAAAAFPARVAHALGVRTLVVTNAAGGLRDAMQPGDLMVIEDHINLMFRNPLIGSREETDTRFPDMSAPYDRELGGSLLRCAEHSGRASSGVYAAVIGPSYETRAELAALTRLGADAVGMSTVPEVIVARALGLCVAGLAVITNVVTNVVPGAAAPLSHADVLAVGARSATRVLATLRDWFATQSG